MLFFSQRSKPARPIQGPKKGVLVSHFFTLRYDKAVFRLPLDVTEPLWPRKRENLLGKGPSGSKQGRLPLCQDLTAPHTLPASLQPLVLGSRFPPLTGKTYLEGGLKGLQTVSDRGCLAADVAWLMCHSTEGPESWGEEVRGCVWGREGSGGGRGGVRHKQKLQIGFDWPGPGAFRVCEKGIWN